MSESERNDDINGDENIKGNGVASFFKKKLVQALGVGAAIFAVGYGTGALIHKGKNPGNLPLNDDQLDRIHDGNVLNFQDVNKKEFLIYKNNPAAESTDYKRGFNDGAEPTLVGRKDTFDDEGNVDGFCYDLDEDEFKD